MVQLAKISAMPAALQLSGDDADEPIDGVLDYETPIGRLDFESPANVLDFEGPINRLDFETPKVKR